MTLPATIRADIKTLYHGATPTTVERDLRRAIDLLKQLDGEVERARVAVYMDGLSQMRSEWILARRAGKKRTGKPRARKKNTRESPPARKPRGR